MTSASMSFHRLARLAPPATPPNNASRPGRETVAQSKNSRAQAKTKIAANECLRCESRLSAAATPAPAISPIHAPREPVRTSAITAKASAKVVTITTAANITEEGDHTGRLCNTRRSARKPDLAQATPATASGRSNTRMPLATLALMSSETGNAGRWPWIQIPACWMSANFPAAVACQSYTRRK